MELSPAPLMWKTLNPEVQLYVLGSAHVSVDHAQYQDEAPLRPEFLDPVYLASKLLCSFMIFLMGVAVVLLLTMEYCVFSYIVNSFNPLYISYDPQEYPSIFFDPPPIQGIIIISTHSYGFTHACNTPSIGTDFFLKLRVIVTSILTVTVFAYFDVAIRELSNCPGDINCIKVCMASDFSLHFKLVALWQEQPPHLTMDGLMCQQGNIIIVSPF